MTFPENVIVVSSGDVDRGMWGIADDIMAKDDNVVQLSELVGCSLVSDTHQVHQSGIGRIAGGIIGAALLGPIGAAGGLLAGGRRRIDQTVVYCSLSDGRSFVGEVSQLTAAKLQQMADKNVRSHQSTRPARLDPQPEIGVPARDVVECPMCAELVKAKAKICRFCGYGIFEEEQKKLSLLKSDPTVESVVPIGDAISAYRAVVAYESEVSNELIVEVVKKFSQLIMRSPNESYRVLADEVKEVLGIGSKTVINDIVREGFKFIRNCPQFDVMDELIVVRKKQ